MYGPVQLLSNRLDQYLRDNDLQDVVIFAHSKGGLVGKMSMSGDEAWRIRGMVSLGTPYAGSELANFAPQVLGVDDLMPAHPAIRRQFTDLRANRKITSSRRSGISKCPPELGSPAPASSQPTFTDTTT